jgi:hypothetical protein
MNLLKGPDNEVCIPSLTKSLSAFVSRRSKMPIELSRGTAYGSIEKSDERLEAIGRRARVIAAREGKNEDHIMEVE